MSETVATPKPDHSTQPPPTRERTGDIFDKAYAFTRADEATAVGMHPYFKPIAEQHGGTVVVEGREMIITGSNDYLGLTQDPRLKAAARGALDNFGTSCTGSRFLTGTLTLHEALEDRLAEFLRAESALTFSSGFLGSLAVLSAIAGRHDIFYFDRENHVCLYDGARLSYGTLRKYEHNNLDELEELLARLRALLRRVVPDAEGDGEVLAFADLTMDVSSRDVARGGRPIELTRTEFTLLEMFLRRPRRVLDRSFILEEVWGYDFPTSANSLEVYVGYLRRKTEAEGESRLIQTVRGVGYVLKEA